MSEIAVRVEELGKRFRIGHQKSGDLRRDFTETLRQIVNRKLRRRDEFWALKDLNFAIKRGEVVGIIGRNGAGKSTLLKILSRITHPTTGRFEIDGRVSSLLEVGTGFHGELTGRENVFLNGTILGMRRAEIKQKFDEIVSFSGVEKFIDTAVKHYSSGMKVRLAFSVAAHLEPEILIIDEVLAVGDAEFQKKCLGKMDDVSKKEGRTVLFVSHNMAAVEGLCNKGILLDSGRVDVMGGIDICIREYVKKSSRSSEGNSWLRKEVENNNVLEIESASLDLNGQQPQLNLEVSTFLRSHRRHNRAFIAYDLTFEDGTPILQAIPTDKPFIDPKPEGQQIKASIALPPLIPGSYRLSVWVGAHYGETFDWQKNILSFDIDTSPMPERTHPHSRKNGFLVPRSSLIQ